MRTIILHYHLFKNAGTSVDAILKQNFGDRWVTREFPMMDGNNSALVEQWIRETPEAVAYSSHTMMGPIPSVEGVKVISFLLLRDPIERIKSAYRFERQQDADTWGAKLAKEHDFEGYVRARLVRQSDRQCRNFQTYRLASASPTQGDSELEKALCSAQEHFLIGRVESFNEAVEDLRCEFADHGISLILPSKSARYNQNDGAGSISNAVTLQLLIEANRDDIEMLSRLSAIGGRTVPET
ncbi:sulfotransferase family 2 domain-containing protein [Cyanobium sp. ATX 6A2]|uniref:sulfotransferase family 2 domain-containing protein n=1 Tax=Cyanobium sp. ATX 6A2 TaxID=2823700 RepID=UPI0020CEF917|nr:sulfotransferase family 2 domain-containing protein [Cyanobium sp. ATX 6A2]